MAHASNGQKTGQGGGAERKCAKGCTLFFGEQQHKCVGVDLKWSVFGGKWEGREGETHVYYGKCIQETVGIMRWDVT